MTRTTLILGAAAWLALAVAPAVRGGEKTVEPFNGKNLDGWVLRHDDPQRNHWRVGIAKISDEDNRQLAVAPAEGQGELVNAGGHGTDIYTEAEFGDCVVTVELMVPKGSNSGVYLMGNYEVQVLDSYGREHVGPGDIGGIYSVAAPRVNAAKAPGQWQTFVIDFTAPRFTGGKKIANARFNKVTLNGTVIQENVEVAGPTGGALSAEKATGPLMFQGDHGAVAYRNIKIVCGSK